MQIKPLNEHIEAVNYQLHIEPNLKRTEKESNPFKGSVIITLNIKDEVKEILLHANKLEVCNAKLQEEIIPIKNIHYKKEEYLLIITLEKPLKIGKATLSLDFKGEMKDDLAGLYRSSYKGRDEKLKYMATTQFEAADARKCFPCIDEPAAKATFDLQLTIDNDLQAISNTLPIKEEKAGLKKTITFDTTPKMSTYLLYIGVGDFDYKEDKLRDIVIRVVAVPGKAKDSKFALDATKKFLSFFEDYFNIKYPLKKLDLIAVPDFGSGAMENWGAITFREDALLFNPLVASLSNKQSIAEIISHELVHQWFGNLVTMQWWNDLWLNESFADFMAFKAVAEHYPELHPWDDFLNQSGVSAYSLDALHASHPINVPVKTPDEIREVFDDISYAKGGMVLRMIESYLGKENFRTGLQNYLKKFQYQNTVCDDLWHSLAEVSGKKVESIMHTWLNQTGHPLVKVSKQDNTLHLQQERFLYLGKDEKTTWAIPIAITTDKEKKELLMEDKKITVEVNSDAWLKVNSEETGFYRVQYDKTTLQNLRNVIKDLSEPDRWGLHSNLSALLIAGKLSLKDYLSCTDVYDQETSYLVLSNILPSLLGKALLFQKEAFFPEIKKYAEKLNQKVFDNLGWEPKNGEEETNRIIRSSAVYALGLLDDETVLKKAKDLFEQYQKNKEAVHPDMKATIFRLAAHQGEKQTYETIKELYKKEENPQEKLKLLTALTAFKDKTLLQQALDYGISKEVRQQNLVYVVVNMSRNDFGKTLVWPWIQKNWNLLKERYSGSIFHLNSMLKSLSSNADQNLANEIKEFMKKHGISGTQRALAQLYEKIEINANFMDSVKKEYQ